MGDMGFDTVCFEGRGRFTSVLVTEDVGVVDLGFSLGRGFSGMRGCILTFGPTLNVEGSTFAASFNNFLNVMDRCYHKPFHEIP